MKVYVVYDSKGEHPIIDKIFNTRRKAYDYVIYKYYSGVFYKDMMPDWLDNNASNFVAEKEVE